MASSSPLLEPPSYRLCRQCLQFGVHTPYIPSPYIPSERHGAIFISLKMLKMLKVRKSLFEHLAWLTGWG
jgi:hypothetical protein